MKKAISWLLVIAMTAALSIGATLAYLTDTDEDVNVMTVGQVKIDQLEYERVEVESKDEDADVQEFHDNKPLYPAVTDKNFVYENGEYVNGDSFVDWSQIGKDGYESEIWDPAKINNEVDKMVFVKNKGDWDAYVRTVFAFEAGSYKTLEEFRSKIHLNLNDTDWDWEWTEAPVAIGEGTYFVATATYNKVLKPGTLTEISLSQIALDSSATNDDVAAFGETYQVLVQSQAVQVAGFQENDVELVNAKAALDEAFGTIPTENNEFPFENDNPTKGIDVRTAVNTYDGKTITSKVQSIVFGKNEDYADIVAQNKGVLVDVEQDVPVYAYYVQNNGLYQIYLLADDSIYLPRDSSRLFQDMSSLVSVDTSNLDTSRVELMNHLFFRCSALTNLDVSGFNMEKVTTVKSMFNLCSALPDVDMSQWNTASLENTSYMFFKCYAFTELDATGLDMGKVTDASYMFGTCNKLKTLDTTGWDLSNVTTTKRLLVDCTLLTDVFGSGDWYLPKVVDLSSMIQNCDSLKSIDVTDWDLSSAENMYSMFWSCAVLETIEGCENWNTGNVTSMKAMFETTHKLKDVDVSTWDTSSVTDMSYMFRAHGLEELDVSNWDVSNVLYFNSMFSAFSSNTGSMSLKKLDLSKWNPKSAVKMNNMFHGCSQITELDLSGWNMPDILTTSHMFSDCYNLKSIDFTGWNTPSLTSMDGMFNDCRAIKQIDVSHFDTGNCVEFSQMFEACHSLEQIIGLNQWDTSSGNVFDEMFNQARSLKELDLSSFDTSSAKYSNVLQNGERNYHGYGSMFSGCNNLTKLTLGESFVFSGDGSIPATHYPKFPSPAAIDGQATLWYNAANDTYYTADEIPEETAATYIAVVKPADNG